MNLPTHEHDRTQALERELAGVIRDFDIVDRGLAVRDSLSIDWLGFDAEGQLVLVLWTSGEGAGVVLDVLDALAFVRSHLDVLARHWGLTPPEAPGGGSGPAPIEEGSPVVVRAVCLADRFDAEALERLSVCAPSVLDLFEIRTVRSEMGEAAYLVPVRHPVAESEAERAPASFFDGLPDGVASTARAFMARMSRVDDELELAECEGAADWFYRGQRLAALRAKDGRLEASLLDTAAVVVVLAERDIDEFVDRVLGRLVELSDGVNAAGTGSDELPELEDGDELEQIELIPMDSGPLLTPEEIAAFHE